MAIFRTVRTLADIRRRFADHPLTSGQVFRAMLRVARYQAAWRLTGEESVHRWIGDSRLIVGRGMTGVTPDAYLGVAEFNDTLFLAHLLRPGDLFVDVGANAGTYTILASKICGAQVLAIEPIAATAARLADNVRLNDVGGLVELVVEGASDSARFLNFTTTVDAINRVVLGDAEAGEVASLPVRTLDSILDSRRPLAIKIDVENHERAVIAGAAKALANPSLQAVVVETAANSRNDAFLDLVRCHGFIVCRYEPEARRLTAAQTADFHNTLFIRDVATISERLQTAEPVRVGDRTF